MCSPHLGEGRAWAGERLERLVQRLLVDLVAVGRNELRERKPATACRGRVSDTRVRDWLRGPRHPGGARSRSCGCLRRGGKVRWA